ncbi:MAG: phosphoenolpyruvate carboxylase, partial [Candidatus Woesearchaeota archaeon]|nr:phosphoenolpyruvate carboxylase [Candidatus Woesearchaeota archaeon]
MNSNIPRVMSTQHPDNVRQPFFVESNVIGGDDEIKEAFYSFSHLKIKEQLWDCEGKEVDNFVVEKLLSRYQDYFTKRKLGKDVFITFRGPNPRIEKNKGKLLLETLESIPRNFDIAKEFYDEDIAPIFEITLPMTASAEEIFKIKDYYKRHIIDRQERSIGNQTIKEWVGEFKPKDINVIPLIEERDSMLCADKIVEEYVTKADVKEYQRVWLARSDPALNYGNLPAILCNRIAFQRLHLLEEKISIDLPPIIGCGSVPFRGNFRPDKMEDIMKAYPSVQTFTMQSAFKYDFPEEKVRHAVDLLENTKRKDPLFIEESKSVDIINKASEEYQKQVSLIAPLVNQVSVHVPNRRKRKMHIGLFGYSRDSSGVKLPRAIKFCGALYSLGLPPEILGMSALDEKDWDFVIENTGIETDLKMALEFFNHDNLKFLPREIQEDYEKIAKRFEYETNPRHKKITKFIADGIKNNDTTSLTENIERAAS